MIRLSLVTAIVALLSACAPEVGSEKWCNTMDKTPKGEWTLDQTKDYTKHCLL